MTVKWPIYAWKYCVQVSCDRTVHVHELVTRAPGTCTPLFSRDEHGVLQRWIQSPTLGRIEGRDRAIPVGVGCTHPSKVGCFQGRLCFSASWGRDLFHMGPPHDYHGTFPPTLPL